jgi:hypothetical protein
VTFRDRSLSRHLSGAFIVAGTGYSLLHHGEGRANGALEQLLGYNLVRRPENSGTAVLQSVTLLSLN